MTGLEEVLCRMADGTKYNWKLINGIMEAVKELRKENWELKQRIEELERRIEK